MKKLKRDIQSPYIPDLMHHSARAIRPAHSTIRKLHESINQPSYGQFSIVFADLMPDGVFTPPSSGSNCRMRNFTIKLTFFLWLHQILMVKSSCEAMVIQARTWLQSLGTLTDNLTSSAYCQARKRLSVLWLEDLCRSIVLNFKPLTKPDPRHLGFNILLVDGTSFALPETPANAAAFPLPAGQKPGCGFPIMPVLGLFSLATGALVEWVAVRYRAHDCRLLPKVFGSLKPGDLLVADRAFGSYFNLASLRQRGVMYVGRLHQMRKFPGAQAQRLGQDDYLVTWTKGVQSPKHYRQEWQVLPDKQQVRLIKYLVEQPGFRTREVILVTTLLDSQLYPVFQVAQIYGFRWQVEVNFRDIKVTMGKDTLSCRTPEMIDKELLMVIIGYNLIRWLISRDASRNYRQIDSYSFGNALYYAATIASTMSVGMTMLECRKKYRAFIAGFGSYHHEKRPDRSEVRAVKRRNNKYKLMNKPRHDMQVESHRNRYKAPATCPVPTPPPHQHLRLS